MATDMSQRDIISAIETSMQDPTRDVPETAFSSSYGNVAGSKKIAYLSVAILCFINMINYMDRFTIAGVLKNVKKYYYLDNTEAGLLQTSFIVGYMITAPIFGYLGDRYNRKWIMICGITFWSIITLAGSFIPRDYYRWFIILRALVGIGEASYSTVAPTIIGDLFSKTVRTRVLALFYFAIPVGSGLGYIIGPAVADAFGHWYWALRVTPGLGALSVILTIFLLKDPPRGEAEGGISLKNSGLKQDLFYLARNRSYTWSTLGFTCVTFATGALAWWAPTYMDYATQLSTGTTQSSSDVVSRKFGIITCVAGITGIILGSVCSQYFRNYNPRADPLICAVGMLGSTPLVFFGIYLASSHTLASWIFVFFAETLLCMNWAIVADILLYVVIPVRRAMAAASQILLSHLLGDACSPYLIGAISDSVLTIYGPSLQSKYISLQYALYVNAFVLVLGGLCFLIIAFYVEDDKKRCSYVTKGVYVSQNSSDSEQSQAPGTPDILSSCSRTRRSNIPPSNEHSPYPSI